MADKAEFFGGRVQTHCGDSRAVLAALAAESFDACVTDPPYALESIVKRFGGDGASAPKSGGPTGAFRRAAGGFLGQKWDTGECAFDPEFWRLALRALKPGGILAAFCADRTIHRLTAAVETAGFEIRRQGAWIYGSGFPKAQDLGGGWKTDVKPAMEPFVVARKPFRGSLRANFAAHGVGGYNIAECRIPAPEKNKPSVGAVRGGGVFGGAGKFGAPRTADAAPDSRFPSLLLHDGSGAVIDSLPDGAAAYFYCAKAGADDREGSRHPTVKPVALMAWLIKLTTPPGGLALDPFAGSGTTGAAALSAGRRAVLVEREPEFYADCVRRFERLEMGDVAAASGADASAADLPLFCGGAQ